MKQDRASIENTEKIDLNLRILVFRLIKYGISICTINIKTMQKKFNLTKFRCLQFDKYANC